MGVPVYAHRGGMARAPENTVAAFRAAFAAGASAIECDIRRTADGQFVAFHDASADRVCGRDWAISRTQWAHLKALRVQGEEPIAHLDDILNLMILRPGKDFYFELALQKESDAADLARQIARAGVEARAYLLAFSHKTSFLDAAAEAVPRIGRAVMPLFPSGLVRTALLTGASKVCAGWIDWPLAKQLFYFGAAACDFRAQAAAAEAEGIEVSAGIANHPRDVKRLAELGARAIWTDDVEMALKYT
ncbi:MAG: glycerophosphodiester phosphodiesterase family protein [Elusimicrobiales bacterium]|nr:glycerophosphodiester phosphodiesterase family protein [Elusimicrobiales bacterium]